ncbi:hypothetical protein ACTU6V_06210 [Microbacterium sp. A204]|uniref:hypothetical protein n=1 Tax=Microbacterium sp. A204 TaxID=3457321 RepID=UPI003FD3F092
MITALAEWSEFNVAMAGASAALAGLVIVAASVNIDKIIHAGTLTARLGAAIASLVLALVASGAALIPRLDLLGYGIVVLACTLIAGAFQVHAMRVIMRDTAPEQRARVVKSVLGYLPIVAYLSGAVLLIAGVSSGLVLVAAGCLLAIVSAIVVSWVVLVEVLR